MTKIVLYSCPFVPAEWIAAHGLVPSRIMPRSAKGSSSVEVTFGVCTYARAFVAAALTDAAAAVVVTTVCDQMRRASELIARSGDAPTFLMNVPSTWETAAVRQLYRDELERLGRFLVELGGHSPSQDELVGVMLAYDARRAAVRAARAWLSPKAHAQAIVAFHEEGASPPEGIAVESVANGIPVALLGGPMLREDLAVFDLVEEAGGRIVLDGTETGERTLPAPFDAQQTERDPLGELTRAYFESILDVSRRPNHELFRWLRQQVDLRGIRGVIYRRHVWCDLWHAELHRVRECIDVPVLDLESGYDDEASSRSRMTGRVQAFLEALA